MHEFQRAGHCVALDWQQDSNQSFPGPTNITAVPFSEPRIALAAQGSAKKPLDLKVSTSNLQARSGCTPSKKPNVVSR